MHGREESEEGSDKNCQGGKEGSRTEDQNDQKGSEERREGRPHRIGEETEESGQSDLKKQKAESRKQK
jgi:hypothetical protein